MPSGAFGVAIRGMLPLETGEVPGVLVTMVIRDPLRSPEAAGVARGELIIVAGMWAP